MDLFHEIPDSMVILTSKGIAYQRKLYRRGNRLYAGHGSGFIRIHALNGTSVPAIRWDDMALPVGNAEDTPADAHGRLLLSPAVLKAITAP